MKKISRKFFARDTHEVAKDLLGKVLARNFYGKKFMGRIVEVEAYVGQDDKACHAARGKTKRNAVMFGEAGHAYIYLIYGMYNCLNFVTEQSGFPAAVLIRAVEPVARLIDVKTDGPGKLTRAMKITRKLNGEDLVTSERLWVAEDDFVLAKNKIKTAKRIGVAYAGEDADLLWRYYVKDSKFVSRPHP